MRCEADHGLTRGTTLHNHTPHLLLGWDAVNQSSMQDATLCDADMMNVTRDNEGTIRVMLTNGWRHNQTQCVTQSPISRERA